MHRSIIVCKIGTSSAKIIHRLLKNHATYAEQAEDMSMLYLIECAIMGLRGRSNGSISHYKMEEEETTHTKA